MSGVGDVTVGMGDQFKSGETISHYKIISKIGQGGMGAVYKAEDLKLRRTVALKFLLHEKFSSIDKQRFLREAQAAAALHHPNICTIYEVDEADGEIFFAMAYLQGETLASRIGAGAIEFDQALELGIQLADALHEAHSHGIVHRDIKSNNIVLTPKNQAVILDFGLAQISGTSKLTQTGATLGTAAYMSPEHARGLEVDRRGDLWSLAVVIYEMATGKLPFRAEQDLAMLYCIVNEPHVPACESRPALPRQFDDIMGLALAKEPAERYQHASELASDLRRLKSLIGIETLATGQMQPLPPPSFWTRRRAVLGGAAAVVAAAGLWHWAPYDDVTKSAAPAAGGPENPLHIAVMPPRCVGPAPGPQEEAYCDGLGEWLGDRLAALESANDSLIVVQPAEVREAGVTGVSDVQKIFGVSRVLTGSVEREDKGWRATLNLVDAVSVRQVRSAEVRAGGVEDTKAATELAARAAGMIGVDSSASADGTGGLDRLPQPEASEAFIEGLGYLRRANGTADFPNAVKQFEHALAADSKNAFALSQLASARLSLTRSKPDPAALKAALTEAQQAVQLDPILPEAHVALGAALSRVGSNEAALNEFREALKIDALNTAARKGLADVLVSTGRPSEAEAVLIEYRQRRPNDVRARQEIARYYADRGRFDDAEREFRAGLKLTPDNWMIPIQLAKLYRQTSRLDQAKAEVERSLAIRPSAEAYAALGSIEFMAKRYLQAATAYEMATEMSPSSPEYWGALADCYRHAPGSEGQSRAAFGRAIDLARRDLKTGGNAESRSRLALYLAKSGQVAEARKELDAIPAGARGGKTALLNAAAVHQLAGDRARASRELKAAIEAGASASEIDAEPDLGGVQR